MTTSTFPTLFAISKTGKIKTWTIETDEANIIVTHGQLLGKMQTITTVATPKNVGRANETTARVQATIEAQAKWLKQMDKKYRQTVSEAQVADSETLLPMLAHDYTKVGHRIKFPCYVSPKLDGLRCIAKVHDNGVVVFHSRGGKQYPVPEHLRAQLFNIYTMTGHTIYDGELYIHGMTLQNITSCVKKPNENTPNLTFLVFDLPSTLLWEARHDALSMLEEYCNADVNIVPNFYVRDEEEAREYMDSYLEDGFEGLMLRNVDGAYEWGNRSGDLQKWKDFQDIEALVESIEEDKLGEGVLLCRLASGVTVRCKMRGTHDSRSYSNMLFYIGSWINIRFQAFTDDGSLQFPVGTGLRNCDQNGQPLE